MAGYHPLGDPGSVHPAGAHPGGYHPTGAQAAADTGSLPSTVLKWCGNGELSALDLERIVQRLRQADPTAQALHPSHFTAIQLDQAC